MDTSPTALFESYEQDYKLLIQSLDDRLASVKADDGLKGGEQRSIFLCSLSSLCLIYGTEERKSALRRVEMELEEADEMVCSSSNRPSSPKP